MELNLKEKIIFAKFKDRRIENFEKFREQQSKKLGFPLSDNLIKQLRIYQNKKFRKIQVDIPKHSINTNQVKFKRRTRDYQRERYQAESELERLQRISRTYTLTRSIDE